LGLFLILNLNKMQAGLKNQAETRWFTYDVTPPTGGIKRWMPLFWGPAVSVFIILAKVYGRP
jgi:hypothetical protein